ncbi:MAG: transporter substrate-binding domain-containing protein [Gammaproteobacteria bacterium]|jgi:polar amino acid transport system substrate-binding protein|nr:transporter substrate-binding domain-containing protein [Gammaproteobacteria bacterium]
MRRLLVLLALGLLLAACQDTESPSARSEPEATAADTAPEIEQTAEAQAAPVPCRLVVGWDPWEPYHYQPVGDRVQGLDVDLIGAMAERADCDLEWEQGSWASMLQLVRTGNIDLLPGATRTPQREEFARFSQPYRTESFRIHVRAEESEQWSGMALTELLGNGFRLGLTRGYIYGSEVEAILDDPRWQDQLVEVPVGELNVLHLVDFRIDGFLEDPFVAASIDHRRDWGIRFETLPLDVYSGDVHLMFSRASVDAGVVDRFDRALSELRESGEHERILDRYTQGH